MTEVSETQLPGVGVRYEFTTSDGDRVGVLCHHTGRREIVVYDDTDPDTARSVVHLTADDARTVSDLLGATQVGEVLGAVQQRIEGLALDWIDVGAAAEMAGRTIGDGDLRTTTGASVVAVIRGDTTEPAPGPEYVVHGGDIVVAVGRPESLDRLRAVLTG